MLSPEVWNFSPPAHHFMLRKGSFSEGETQCFDLIDSHYFNHLVSVVLPDTINVPAAIKNSLKEDCDYYKIDDLHVTEFTNKEFIEAFIKKGHLTVLSVGTHIDTDDCAAVTPSGHLILSVNKQTYQELGLEGKPSFFSKRNPSRYVVELDLKGDHFTPGKKNYERVQQRLRENPQLKMNFLVAWDPPEEKICPSSVAAYLSSRGYKVSLCHVEDMKQVRYNVKIPEISADSCDEATVLDLMEWLGAFSIGAELESGNVDSFISTYECDLDKNEVGATNHLKWTGFFTFNQIHNLLNELRTYLAERPTLPWISLYVQGFADSPVSWKLKEHQYYTNGDNNYVIFIKPDKTYIACSYISSNKRPRNKT